MQLGEPEVASDAEAIRKRAAEVLGKAKPRLASSGAAVGTPNSREAVSRSIRATPSLTSPASSAGEQPPSAARAKRRAATTGELASTTYKPLEPQTQHVVERARSRGRHRRVVLEALRERGVVRAPAATTRSRSDSAARCQPQPCRARRRMCSST